MKNIVFITFEEVLAIHDSMVEQHGGSFGIRDAGLIQSAISRPQASFGGQYLYESIFDKAAALFHSLLFNHAFVDGNKRTTVTSTARFLHLNGYDFVAEQEEIVTFALLAENTHPSLEEIALWLQKHTKKKASS